jgi:hypothetical protein
VLLLHGWLRHPSACGDPFPHDPFVASPADQRRPPRLKRAHRTHDRPAGQRQHLETRSSRCHILMLARPSMIRPTRQSTEVDRSDPPIWPSRQKFRRPLDDSETEGRRCSIGATSTEVKPANSHSSGEGLGENSPSALSKQPRRRVMSTPWTCAATRPGVPDLAATPGCAESGPLRGRQRGQSGLWLGGRSEARAARAKLARQDDRGRDTMRRELLRMAKIATLIVE